MSNKKIGNNFESELCQILYENGFWAHNMAQNEAGQPADVIACRNLTPFLIDCKVCSNDEFPLRRIEGNQESSMTLWKCSGNNVGWFAFKLTDGKILMVGLSRLLWLREFKSCLNRRDLECWGMPLDRWLDECEEMAHWFPDEYDDERWDCL